MDNGDVKGDNEYGSSIRRQDMGGELNQELKEADTDKRPIAHFSIAHC